MKKDRTTKSSKSQPSKSRPSLDFSDLINQRKKIGAGGNRFSIEDVAKIRVLPFEHDGKLQVFAIEQTHFNPSPDVKAITCLGPDRNCPLCDLYAEGVESCKPSVRCLCNIVDMDDPKQAVQLYQAPPSVMGPMADVFIDVDEHPDMMDPKKGKPFIVKKTGSGKNTRYTVQVSGKPASYDPKLLESVTDLQAVADRPKDVVAINELADRIRANSTF